MAKISACIISFNEEKKIEGCLKSLGGLADEIVLVDSESTDRTVEIARKYTDKIYTQAFLGYVAQKNLAAEKAAHDWILNLDCDERLSPALAESIRAVKADLDAAAAYAMARRTYYVHRWMNHCWYPDRKIRLYHRRKARWVGESLHEKVVQDGGGAGGVKTLAGDLLHYSFDSLSDHLQTIDRFTEIGAREIVQSGKKVGLLAPLTHGFGIFFKMYVLKRGFLDGYAGFAASVLSFVHVFVKYSKVILRQDDPGPS